MSSIDTVQIDWEDRELVEIVQLNVLKLVSMLNKFDVSVRSKLSTLSNRLNKIERQIVYCDAIVRTIESNADELDR